MLPVEQLAARLCMTPPAWSRPAGCAWVALLAAARATVGGLVGALVFVTLAVGITFPAADVDLGLLFDTLIPGLAAGALLVSAILCLRAVVRSVETAVHPVAAVGHHVAFTADDGQLVEGVVVGVVPPGLKRRRGKESGWRREAVVVAVGGKPVVVPPAATARCGTFGRKGLVCAACSLLFAASCAYRALNIADEGARACWGESTPFNAPVAGRFVATVGEVALVVQIMTYIDASASRLNVRRGGLWAAALKRLVHVPFTTVGPALAAEVMSWTGVVSGVSRFYCAEYCLWMLIAITWAWDGAELLHKSRTTRDQVTHAALLLAGCGLFFFNACVEIPHFFAFTPEAAGTPLGGLWACTHMRESPLWAKRVPFFVCYFVGCSWASVALTYQFTRRRRDVERAVSDHPPVPMPRGAAAVASVGTDRGALGGCG